MERLKIIDHRKIDVRESTIGKMQDILFPDGYMAFSHLVQSGDPPYEIPPSGAAVTLDANPCIAMIGFPYVGNPFLIHTSGVSLDTRAFEQFYPLSFGIAGGGLDGLETYGNFLRQNRFQIVPNPGSGYEFTFCIGMGRLGCRFPESNKPLKRDTLFWCYTDVSDLLPGS